MSEQRAFWQELYRRFDPEEPARKHDWRAQRPYSPRDQIISGLDRPFGGTNRYLLIGTVGTGKSTELLAVAEEQSARHMVVFFDVRRHFAESVRDSAALDHVQPWEVLLLIGLALYRAAQDAFGEEWASEHIEAMQRVITAFSRDDDSDGTASVDLAKLTGNLSFLASAAVGGIAGAGLALVKPVADAARWSFRLGRRRDRVDDQDGRVIDLLNAVNHMIGTLQQAHQKLVLVIDGLDRIEKIETTRDLFVDSTLLGSLACATIVSGSIALRREGIARQLRHFEPVVLANAPVLMHDDPDTPGPGISFLLDVYRLRVADVTGADIPEPLLRKLAYYSGGHGRDFVRLVRMTAERAWDRDLSCADEAVIDEVIDERRRVMEMGLDRAEIDLLRNVVDDPEHRLPDSERVDALLDQRCLMPYPNRSEWYFPHPLLMLELLRIKTG